MKKMFFLLPSVAGVLLLTACSASVIPEDGGADSSLSSAASLEADTSSSAAAMDSETEDDTTVPADDSAMESDSSETAEAPTEARVIVMNTSNWEFDPKTIQIKKGENVILRVEGDEGSHGVAIPELGIDVKVAAGETKDIPLYVEKTGTFAFFCSVPCGEGHKDMKGTIVVS